MKTLRMLTLAIALVAMSTVGYLSVSLAEEGKSIEQLITEAKTPADHEAIAKYYDQEAQAAHKKHQEHLQLKSSYGKTPHLASKTGLPQHCEQIATSYDKIAKEYEALAKVHRDAAQSSK